MEKKKKKRKAKVNGSAEINQVQWACTDSVAQREPCCLITLYASDVNIFDASAFLWSYIFQNVQVKSPTDLIKPSNIVFLIFIALGFIS